MIEGDLINMDNFKLLIQKGRQTMCRRASGSDDTWSNISLTFHWSFRSVRRQVFPIVSINPIVAGIPCFFRSPDGNGIVSLKNQNKSPSTEKQTLIADCRPHTRTQPLDSKKKKSSVVLEKSNFVLFIVFVYQSRIEKQIANIRTGQVERKNEMQAQRDTQNNLNAIIGWYFFFLEWTCVLG